MMKRLALAVLGFGLVVGNVSASGAGLLAKFSGGIGADPVAGVVGPANQDGSFQNVKVNVVRGINPAGGPWRIDDLKAEIDTNGNVNIRGTGLLLANGDKIGTNANLVVFATLICENAGPFQEHSTPTTGVALDQFGDFRIDDTLDSVPSSCPNPALLIRSVGGSHAWFAAGIPVSGSL